MQEISVLVCFLQWWAFWICKDFCCCLTASCAIWSWFEFKCTTEDALKIYILETQPFEHQLQVFFLKRHCAGSFSNFNFILVFKKCASNYRKWKINKSQTCVTFSPIIINKGRILGQRLEQKHSPLLLTDEIKLSLERLPKSRTLTGKIETILSSECRVTFNYNLTDGSLISWCPFQRRRPGVATRSSLRPRQVLTWFSKSRTKQKD